MQVPTVRTLLMHLEYFQAGTVRSEVAYVDGVAMALAGSVKQVTVVVHGARTIENLVFAVAIDVSYREIVVAIAIESVGTAARSVA